MCLSIYLSILIQLRSEIWQIFLTKLIDIGKRLIYEERNPSTQIHHQTAMHRATDAEMVFKKAALFSIRMGWWFLIES